MNFQSFFSQLWMWAERGLFDGIKFPFSHVEWYLLFDTFCRQCFRGVVVTILDISKLLIRGAIGAFRLLCVLWFGSWRRCPHMWMSSRGFKMDFRENNYSRLNDDDRRRETLRRIASAQWLLSEGLACAMLRNSRCDWLVVSQVSRRGFLATMFCWSI